MERGSGVQTVVSRATEMGSNDVIAQPNYPFDKQTEANKKRKKKKPRYDAFWWWTGEACSNHDVSQIIFGKGCFLVFRLQLIQESSMH
eukprot:m.67372 g.67372  ORF g.67372 m.67372 type:complete len:88 (-) comp12161_c0_seq2:643-906(-)